jgi:dolichyl-phosphate-mannose-protein mannosyltransferase
MPNGARARWEPEAHQPPLYYGLVALLTLNDSMDDAEGLVQRNPHFLGTIEGNTNFYAPVAPHSEAVLYIGRIVSLAFGAMLGLFTYAIAREFVGSSVAALAMALAILNPQFLFISTSVSNDVPGAAVTTCGLWLVVRMAQHGVTIRRVLAFGLVVGLATLFKLSGLALLALLPLLALSAIRKDQQPLRVMGMLSLAVVPAACVLIPWFIYNIQTYGDPLATSALFIYMGQRNALMSLQLWGDLSSLLWRSYWLDFSGGGLAYANGLVYIVPALIVIVGVIGALWQAWRQPTWRWPIALLGVWFALVLGALLSVTTRTAIFIGGGRLLYPAASAVAIIIALGLSSVSLSRLSLVVTISVVLIATATIPLYLWPQNNAVAWMPDRNLSAAQGAFTLEEKARMTGYTIEPADPGPGDVAHIYIAWQVLQPLEENYSVFVQLLDFSDPAHPRVVSQLDTYPRLGSLPTQRWRVGQTILDRYPLRVPSDVRPGWHGVVIAGLYNFANGQRLQVSDALGARTQYNAALVGALVVKADR